MYHGTFEMYHGTLQYHVNVPWYIEMYRGTLKYHENVLNFDNIKKHFLLRFVLKDRTFKYDGKFEKD